MHCILIEGINTSKAKRLELHDIVLLIVMDRIPGLRFASKPPLKSTIRFVYSRESLAGIIKSFGDFRLLDDLPCVDHYAAAAITLLAHSMSASVISARLATKTVSYGISSPISASPHISSWDASLIEAAVC